ncbi:hypothetical protein PGIGA_G00107360 [Pangasianodon gigas]|uniref:Uncharacterized protein n=1 Tax=Pangasianodon gigas TaxID=30993 RepID=A0ACC5WA97_PANGG|nr:hypothetical protein [Pangasianodon gigas]
MLGAIQRDSYGYHTFFANRVGKIQKAGSVEDWWWIPGGLNVADLITRGATPEDLQEDSVWQNGPEFLRQPVEEWPKKSAKEVAAYTKEGIDKLQRKSFSAALTRAQTIRNQNSAKAVLKAPIRSEEKKDQSFSLQNNPDGKEPDTGIRRAPASSAVMKLIDTRKFSSLMKLVRVIAWVWRAAMKWKMVLEKSLISNKSKCEEFPSTEDVKSRVKHAVLTVGEYEDALRDLFLAMQEGITFQDTTLNRLAVFRDEDTGLLVCGGRFQIFNKEKMAVPILPYEAWISTLLAQEAHGVNHKEIAGTLLQKRKKAWVIRGRKLVKRVVDNCVACRKTRARKCQQIMGDLPPE